MSYKKTGNDEIEFCFEPTKEQVKGMQDLGLTETEISNCIEQLLEFLYQYNPSILTKLRMKAGKQDKKIEEKLLEIAETKIPDKNSGDVHKLAGLLLSVFFALNEEILNFKRLQNV